MYRLLFIRPNYSDNSNSKTSTKEYEFYIEALTMFCELCIINDLTLIISDFKLKHFVAVNKDSGQSLILYYFE